MRVNYRYNVLYTVLIKNHIYHEQYFKVHYIALLQCESKVFVIIKVNLIDLNAINISY